MRDLPIFGNLAMSDPELINEQGTTIWLTPDGHDKLKKELEHLTMVKRPEIAERIRDSQDHGEYSEDNSELDEVKFEQAIVETRIAELKAIFGTASILEFSNLKTDRVGIGNTAKIRDLDWHDEFEVRIVMSIEADPNNDLISVESPLGSAIYGQEEGVEVSYLTPDGTKKVKILSIGK